MAKRLEQRKKSVVDAYTADKRGGAPKKRKTPYIKRSFNIDRDLYALLMAAAHLEKSPAINILQNALREHLNKNYTETELLSIAKERGLL